MFLMCTRLRIRQQISKLIFLHIFERWQMLNGSSENKLAFLAKNLKDCTVAAVCITVRMLFIKQQ